MVCWCVGGAPLSSFAAGKKETRGSPNKLKSKEERGGEEGGEQIEVLSVLSVFLVFVSPRHMDVYTCATICGTRALAYMYIVVVACIPRLGV